MINTLMMDLPCYQRIIYMVLSVVKYKVSNLTLLDSFNYVKNRLYR